MQKKAVAVQRMCGFGALAVGLMALLVGTAEAGELVAYRVALEPDVYVAPGALCGAVTPCFGSLQEAVDAAVEGAVIRVAEGTYTDVHVRPRADVVATGSVSQTVYLSNTVTIRGGHTMSNWTAPDPETHLTTLDALGQGRVFYVTGAVSPSIEGLRIQGGNAGRLGGGLEDEDSGGGVYVISATLALSDCVVADNEAPEGDGGGLFVLNAPAGTVHGSMFTRNRGWGGAGLASRQSDLLIHDSVFDNNYGSGLDIFSTSGTVLQGNLVRGNWGGGIKLGMADPRLEDNVIVGNRTNENGGGIECFGGGVWRNNVIADNWAGGRGSAIYFNSAGSAELYHTTIARNSGGDGSAIYVTYGPALFASHATLVNTIFVSHTIAISVTADHTVDVQQVLWHRTLITSLVAPGGTLTVNGELTGDPAFAPDGYHVTPWSAAIDQGIDAGVGWDLDGQARPAGDALDLGADEAWWQAVWLAVALHTYAQP